MNETTKSLIRHIITALSFVLGLVGLNKFTGLLDIITQNIDGLIAAISTVVGVVGAFIGFFRNKERLTGGAGVILFLLCSNVVFASEFRLVHAVGFPDDTCSGYYQSGVGQFYSLACCDPENVFFLE